MGMVLSTSTFALDPGGMTMIRPDKVCASVQTYSGVAYFSWGSTIVGKEIELSWNAMPSTQFDNLQAIYVADTTVIFKPRITGLAQNYVVNVTDLQGDYYISAESSANYWRTNCKLKLLIMSTSTDATT